MKIEVRNGAVTIEGYVNVTERLSKPIRDVRGNFLEKVQSGAFNDDAEIEPPSYLTKTQLEAFHFIVDALRQAKVLSRLDTQTIIQASVAIDMLHTANKRVAKRPTLD